MSAKKTTLVKILVNRAEIVLSNGKVALIDIESAELIRKFRWMQAKVGYAIRNARRGEKAGYMHRLLLNATPGIQIDHVNRNKLDNRKKNLRLCTDRQNKWNLPKRCDNKSGYTGVSWDKKAKKWLAKAQTREGGQKYLGYFETKEAAYSAYKVYIFTTRDADFINVLP